MQRGGLSEKRQACRIVHFRVMASCSSCVAWYVPAPVLWEQDGNCSLQPPQGGHVEVNRAHGSSLHRHLEGREIQPLLRF